MADLITAIPNPPAFIETRCSTITIVNHLDAVGIIGAPGKYEVALDIVGEQLDSSRTPITLDGVPVRVKKPKIVFDPMDYMGLEITRANGTTFFLGAFFADMLTAVDAIKGGLPAPATDEEIVLEDPPPVVEDPPE